MSTVEQIVAAAREARCSCSVSETGASITIDGTPDELLEFAELLTEEAHAEGIAEAWTQGNEAAGDD
jgi:hypothetical protein